MPFNKMTKKNNSLIINSKRNFLYDTTIKNEYKRKAFDFAYSMTFGSIGEHRNHRSGGLNNRKNGEIFCDTFQGKLSEYAIYQTFSNKYNIKEPDLECYELGKWDQFDFQINNKVISVKSTKHFGNLLLLEKNDWNKNGEYIPNNNEKIDYTFLVRIKDDITSTLKNNRLYYLNNIEKEELWKLFIDLDIFFDIPGYITNADLVYLIDNDYIINQGELLNERIVMDATNYYCQAGDLRNINEFMED